MDSSAPCTTYLGIMMGTYLAVIAVRLERLERGMLMFDILGACDAVRKPIGV